MSLDALDPLPPLSEFVGALVGLGLEEETLDLTELTLELPIELQLGRTGEGLDLGASPPTQRIETTVLPVFHRLRVTFAAEHAEQGGGHAGDAS
jgi:hypothetical protein